MKFLSILLTLALLTSSTFAMSLPSVSPATPPSDTKMSPGNVGTIDNLLVEEYNNQTEAELLAQLADAKKSLTLKSVTSCENFDTILTEWIKKNKDQFVNPYPTYRRGGGIMSVQEDMAVSNPAPTASVANETKANPGADVDFSSTNVQKAGIDEPDIVKNDGDFIYYVNNTKKLLYIVKGPYQNSKLDLTGPNVVKIMRLPKSFNATDLLISNNTLALVSTRYTENNFDDRTSFFDTNTKTNVYVLNIANKTQPKIIRLFDFPGQLQDARLNDGKLYIVSNLYFSRGPIYRALQEKKPIDTIPTVSNIIPSGMEAIIKSSGKIDKFASNPGCSNLQYILPEKLNNFNPNIAMVHTIDLNSDVPTQTNLFYGNAGQIHLTDKSLYIVNSINLNTYNYNSCPPNAKCIMPLIWRAPDEFSLIHKYNLIKGKPTYQNSAVIRWSLLNQYSMDENESGEFRILTRSWSPELSTHLWKFDPSLNLQSQLLNIEPGEEFKSSRFIGYKLYLVTFKQIDPLFVIDLVGKPKILGELKIPWFSQYLHPYSAMKNGKQLLIWLGVDTIEKDGRTTTNGVKLDLYEVDYNMVTKNEIGIKQLFTKTLGGKNSYTEAIDNPRVFVWNEKTKQLLLPIITQNEIEKKTCSKDYYGQEYCYPNYTYDTTFAGLKKLSINATSGISEISSKDYKTQIINYLKLNNQYYGNERNNYGLDQWQYMNLGNRVGYFWDISYFINNAFVDFSSSQENKLINF